MFTVQPDRSFIASSTSFDVLLERIHDSLVLLMLGRGLSPDDMSEDGEEARRDPSGLANLMASLGVRNAQVLLSGVLLK